MEFFTRIIRKIKGEKKKAILTTPVFETEDEYYNWFFTQNENWNKTTPNSDEQLRWNGIKQFVEAAKAKTDHPLQILDLGCGRGWLTNLLSEYGSVRGIEPVAPVVKYANKIFPDLNIITGNSSLLLAEGNAGKFDLIVSSEVLEHVPEDEKNNFAANINELLKEDGYAIISTPRKEAQEEYCKMSDLTQPVEEWLSEADVKQLFVNNNFEVANFQKLSRSTSVENKLLDIYQLWLFKKTARL